MRYEDIIYKKDISKIKNWMRNVHNPNYSNVLLVVGKVGSGKTTLCKLIEKQYRQSYQFFTFGVDYLNEKNVIHDITRHKNVVSLFNQKSVSKGIIFDNIQVISTFIKSLILVKSKKYNTIPIIITIDTAFKLDNLTFKFTQIDIKPQSLNSLTKIYSNSNVNSKIVANILRKSNGDFNYINKTLLFIKLSPTINLNMLTRLNKDVDLSNYVMLLKFINSKTIDIEYYDYNFAVFVFNNLSNVLNLIKIDFNTKLNYINQIYNDIQFINNDYVKVFLFTVKHILNSNNVKGVRHVSVTNSSLHNNNIKSINENVAKKTDDSSILFYHNRIKENSQNKYKRLQKYLKFQYV